jgi:hypothetical protein
MSNIFKTHLLGCVFLAQDHINCGYWIHSDLSVSGPSTLSIYFTLETKGMEGFSRTEGGKAAEDLESLLMAIV